MKTQNNLYITYCVLLSITFICSCCLLLAVAAENIAASLPSSSDTDNTLTDATAAHATPTLLSPKEDVANSPVGTTAPLNVDDEANPIEGIATTEIHKKKRETTISESENVKLDSEIVIDKKNANGLAKANKQSHSTGSPVDSPLETQKGPSDKEDGMSEQNLNPINSTDSEISESSNLTDLQGQKPNGIVLEIPTQTLEPLATSLETPLIVPTHSNDNENDSLSSPSSTTLDIQSEPTHTVKQLDERNNSNDLNDSYTAIVENVNFDKRINNSNDNTAAATEVKEVPIPVFSEWAQKQMEEQQAMEQQVFNTNSYKNKNQTNDGATKVQPLKIRAKNYASPDCGAKIIASNTDATNTGAVLSSSKDEYMLSPCGNRIWFVVELCEAIQARKIDVANFELFSSSPRNFTVAVSNRFPTRDWSNVGRFVAADKRTIQSFELHPHLFGKFIRVDIHSHYSKEHFCPVSLFRVFGTSEFEAFETENHPSGNDDDLDDDFDEEHSDNQRKVEPNLFKSASDAVLSIVKKAAEVLVKPTVTEYNNTLSAQMLNNTRVCCTPVFAYFSCATCPKAAVEQINRILSCDLPALMHLLHIPQVRNDLLNTRVCHEKYGLDVSSNDCNGKRNVDLDAQQSIFGMDIKQSYYLNLLSADYIGGLCQILYADQLHLNHERNNADINTGESIELNLTIGKKMDAEDIFKLNEKTGNIENNELPVPLIKNIEIPVESDTNASNDSSKTLPVVEHEEVDVESGNNDIPTTTISNEEDNDYAATVSNTQLSTESLDEIETFEKGTAPDINIFNSPPIDLRTKNEQSSESDLSKEAISTENTTANDDAVIVDTDSMDSVATLGELPLKPSATVVESEDEDKWINMDEFLIPTTATPNSVIEDNTMSLDSNIGGIADNGGSYSGANQQQKLIPSGPQSESVFIRLSNRIKALERNMSLSGQYLEELSRRYKKQVEELQLILTQQTQTVRLLEEQGRQHSESANLLAQRNMQLKDELDDLTLQVHACIVLIIFVGVFVFILLMIAILFYRSMRRDIRDINGMLGKRTYNNKPLSSAAMSGAVGDGKPDFSRRKSYEDLSSDQYHPEISAIKNKKQRRPSEEAMLILKDCVDTELQVATENINSVAVLAQSTQQRSTPFSHGNISLQSNNNNKVNNGEKRRNKKLSWPQTSEQRNQAIASLRLQHGSQYCDNLIKPDAVSTRKWNPQNELLQQGGGGAKKKRKSGNLKRQESAPIKCAAAVDDECLHVSAPVEMLDNVPLLDEEDINNFIPNADLAYNEFMPDGPFNNKLETSVNKSSEPSKTQRITSVIFKSPFSKNSKTKSGSSLTTKLTPPHESTSWEWYRLNRKSPNDPVINTSANNLQHTALPSAGGRGQQPHMSPSSTIESPPLSKVSFSNHSTENSFRMLEEAIISSGDSTDLYSATTGTRDFNSSNSHSSESSNRSSTSSTMGHVPKTKKNYRSFNRIFRKVF